MLTHGQIWAAIDALARKSDLSPSGLAKKAGLDPTSFNKSKRKAADGKERWPSTESLAKILEATRTTTAEFFAILSSIHEDKPLSQLSNSSEGFAETQSHLLKPGSKGQTSATLPSGVAANLLQAGDTLLLSEECPPEPGARMLISLADGQIIVARIMNINETNIEIQNANDKQESRTLERADIISMKIIQQISLQNN